MEIKDNVKGKIMTNPPHTYKDLVNKVVENDGVLTISMERLRNINGSGRLGKYVIEEIEAEIKKNGLLTQPKSLPNSSWKCVRIFQNGTKIASVYEALTTEPNQEDQMEANIKNDEKIRSYFTDDAENTLTQIKRLVCQ